MTNCLSHVAGIGERTRPACSARRRAGHIVRPRPSFFGLSFARLNPSARRPPAPRGASRRAHRATQPFFFRFVLRAPDPVGATPTGAAGTAALPWGLEFPWCLDVGAWIFFYYERLRPTGVEGRFQK